MSGHSKWSQIKHQKGIADHKKGQLFSKLTKKIILAARTGTDPSTNHKLQSIIAEAKSFDMPRENIERALSNVNDKETALLDRIIIQAMGPTSIAVVVEAITDNKNRTINELKNIFLKNNYKVVPENSLNWLFDKKWSPRTPIHIEDAPLLSKFTNVCEELRSHEDVENVFTNFAPL